MDKIVKPDSLGIIEKSTDILRVSDRATSILIREYGLAKRDAAYQQSQLEKQTTYIQLYGMFLFLITALAYGGGDMPSGSRFALLNINIEKLDHKLKLAIMIGGAALLFYLASAVTASSYAYEVMRRRLADLERTINAVFGQPLLRFERELYGHFYGPLARSGATLTPYFWSGFWRLVLFVGASYVLIFLSSKFLGEKTAVFYSANIFYFTWRHLSDYVQIHFRSVARTLEESDASTNNTDAVLVAINYIFNYFVVIFIFFAVFGELSIWVQSLVSQIFPALIDIAPEYKQRTIALAIGIYTFLCALFLPTPSEAPLLLTTFLPLPVLFLVACFGKALGSVGLAFGVSWYMDRPDDVDNWLGKLVRKASGSWQSSIGVQSWLAVFYFVFQSIPFLPMRTSTLAYAHLVGRTSYMYLVVFILSGVGTFFRMYLMALLLTWGQATMPFEGINIQFDGSWVSSR